MLNIRFIVCAFAIAAYCVGTAYAQDGQPGNAPLDYDVRPLSQVVAHVDVITGSGDNERRIAIHPEGASIQQDQEKGKRYFHKPLFTIDASGEIDGYPAWVIDEPSSENDSTYLPVRVRLSSLELREICKHAVFQKTEGVQFDSIQILPWPTVRAIAVCRDRRNNEILAICRDDRIEDVGDDWRLDLEVANDQLATLLKRAEDGHLEFDIRYTYLGSKVEGATLTLEGEVDIEAVAKENLRSEQLNDDDFIYQTDVSSVGRIAAARVKTVIVATSTDYVPIVKPTEMAAILFNPKGFLTLDKINELSKEKRAHIANYLKPAQRTLVENTTEQDKWKKIVEDQTSLDLGIDVPIYGAVLKTGIKVEDLERLEHEWGVKFKRNNTTVSTLPTQVKTFTLKTAINKINLKEQSSIYIPVGSGAGFQATSFDPETFGVGKVEFRFDNQQITCEVCTGRGRVICEHCDGFANLSCPTCDGHGVVKKTSRIPVVVRQDCRICGGDGKITLTHMSINMKTGGRIDAWKPTHCIFCSGTGGYSNWTTHPIPYLDLCPNNSCVRGLVYCPAAVPSSADALENAQKHGPCVRGYRDCGRCLGKGYYAVGERD